MSFKLRSGNKTNFKNMGSSPAKRMGIFVGEGENRERVGSLEAAEREAAGETVTRTALDNPDKEEGAQQIKNLGDTYAEIDSEMQERAEGKETLNPSQTNYRKKDDPNLMIRMMSDGPVTAKDAEKTIRKHENLEGGDPMRIEGESYYIVNGKKMTTAEFEAWKNNKNKKQQEKQQQKEKEKISEEDMFSPENQAKLKEMYKNMKNKKNK